MPIFALDEVRNARIDQQLELVLQDVREDVFQFPFSAGIGSTGEIVEAYDIARPRLNVILAQLQSMVGACGADVSTGLGFLPVLLTRLGLTVQATERDLAISEYASAHGIAVLPYHLGKVPAPFLPGSLDFLVFAEVLEHLKLSPVPVLRELAGLIRPGGRFVLTTPNIARLEHLEALATGENFLEPFPEDLALQADATDYVEHVREYSIRETVEAIESAGMGIEYVLMTGWGAAGYQPLSNPYLNEICVVIART